MADFHVRVIIENKQYVTDPEGETILKDLISKGGYTSVRSVRSARVLNLIVESEGGKEAEGIVRKLCEELRIYNPVVSTCKVETVGQLGKE